MTPEGRKKFLLANLQRIVEKRGRTGKKRCGVITLERVTPECDNDNDSDEQKKKGRQVFQEKIEG